MSEGRITTAEERFENWRQRVGLFLAPVVALVLFLVPLPGLKPEAHRLLAILGATVVLWICEAIPLPATALLSPALCVLAGVADARTVFKSFSDPIIFLFIGSFLLAEAMIEHGLNRRVAVQILSLPGVGRSPQRLLIAYAAITAFISMWISNTATTAMMFPIGVAILTGMARHVSAQAGREVRHTDLRFGTALMLMAAFASSVGGLATPVGTPPNLIGLGQIERSLDLKIGFFQWMIFGTPLAVALVIFLVISLNRSCPAEPGLLDGGLEWLRQERAHLGRLTRAEANVLIAFALTITFWLLPGIVGLIEQFFPTPPGGSRARWLNEHLPESVVGLLGALLLFALPVNWRERRFTLTWREATRIDWGTILLFGGGMALGELMFATGLAQWIGEGLARALNAHTPLGLIALSAAIAILVSETTSNAASATMVVPVAIAVAKSASVDPLPPALAACLGASMGFMLPVSTAPNAIVYGTGCVPLLQMVKNGLLLDLFGFVLIVAAVYWLVPIAMRVQ